MNDFNNEIPGLSPKPPAPPGPPAPKPPPIRPVPPREETWYLTPELNLNPRLYTMERIPPALRSTVWRLVKSTCNLDGSPLPHSDSTGLRAGPYMCNIYSPNFLKLKLYVSQLGTIKSMTPMLIGWRIVIVPTPIYLPYYIKDPLADRQYLA